RKYRLQSEAEWEYACRGGALSSTPYHFGDTISSTLANFNDNLKRTCKVGSYKPNAFGLCDMHGNVWEWCSDWFDSDYYKNSPRRDPPGPSGGSGRVYRGGGWYGGAGGCRSACRGRGVPADRNQRLGFR